MNAKLKLRARIILILILFIAFSFSITLYRTQIVNGDSYSKKAQDQYIKPVNELFDRGSIFFSAKDGTKVQVATLKSGYKVYINPNQISNIKSAFDALVEYIDLDQAEFYRKAQKKDDRYEEVAKQVSEATANSIKNLKITGVGVVKETWRLYPGDEMSAHELGLVGESASSSIVVGKYGLERFYENTLSRSDSASLNAFAGLFGNIKNITRSSTEGDIISSIEPTTQKYLEKILKDVNEKWHPETVGGIVIDPNTGEIIAMGSLPTFNLNNTGDVKTVKVFSNPLVENVYEMGSIIKPLTMATGLDSSAFYPDSTYVDEGTLTLSGKKISNHDLKAHGEVSMQEILNKSLNVGAATIALEVGKQEFSKYFLNFGMGSKTGIDLPNEAMGIIGNLKTGRDVEIATIAYGQGIALSPINVTRALSILANGGYIITPHLIKEVRYNDGNIKKISFPKGKPVLKKQTTEEVTKMLVYVVDHALLKGGIKNERYSIAAKTGTAQIPDQVNGGYYQDKYLHSFFGYFPAYNPKYLVFLYQVAPKGTEYAADTLTYPFDQIAKFLINYFNVAPDR